ncbi:MAG: DNA alkylation repair protein [Candidatus Omnitrophota bacterium]
MIRLDKIKNELKRYSNKKKAKILRSFFKTGPGEYGQGDLFLGATVPQIRKIANMHYRYFSYTQTAKLLKSKIHEERLLALLILVSKYQRSGYGDRQKIYKLYLKSSRYINNWDLVDLTAPKIVGEFLVSENKEVLYDLARSKSLWERRIAIIATFRFIKKGYFKDSLRIAKILLYDREDLIQKAVGWMLREVGKRDQSAEEAFLKKHYKNMPRTMLRYAIERFEEKKRQGYLRGKY